MNRSLLLFIAAGAVGFLVDAGVLIILRDPLGLYLSRLISFVCAVLITWLLNRNFAFKESNSGYGFFREFFIYFSAMMVGGAFNYGTYAILVFSLPFFALNPVASVAVGSFVGLGVNWVSSRYFIFNK